MCFSVTPNYKEFAAKPSEYEKARDALYRDWLPQSGYQSANQTCYEFCRNDPKNDPDGNHIVDLCVPLKPL
jgi:AraC family transcriptional regulator